MADCPSSEGAGVHSQQAGILGCVVSEVWLATEESTQPLCLWFCFFH